jgi:hypothetical protein
MSTPVRHAMHAAALAVLLSACGGGGENANDTGNPQTPVGAETAQSVSANTLVLGPDAVNANAAVLRTARAVVAAGPATTTIPCGGGGTARFTASGGSGLSLLNGVLDAGERYGMVFDTCRVSANSDSLSGVMTLEVLSASATELVVQASLQGVVVARPHRTLTLNGSSTIYESTVTSGSTVTTTSRWVSPQIALVSLHNLRLSSLTLSNVDLTSTSTTIGGVPAGSTSSGTLTITVAWPNHSWSATIATQGTANYDANGVATQGSWLMSLPHDRIGLVVAAGLATVTLDHGPDGIIDRSFFWGVPLLVGLAA